MTRITDSYSPINGSVAKAIKAAGYIGCARYLGAKTLKLPNGMTRGEVAVLKAEGLKIVSIFETNPTRASYFTAEQAKKDASIAIKEARWLEQSAKTAIYFTVDFDAQQEDMPAIIDYFEALREEFQRLRAPYKIGAYGGIRTLEELHVSHAAPDAYWQTIAWSDGKRFAGAALYQAQVAQTVGGIGVDVNEVLVADPGWWPKAAKLSVAAVTKAPATAEKKEVSEEYASGYADGVEAAIKQLEAMKK